MIVGRIVKSDSQLRYHCQIAQSHEVDEAPHPRDYGFGTFVRCTVSTGEDDRESLTVGIVCDTQLINSAFGQLSPRLSNENQVEVFSPDYVSERATIVVLLMIGMIEGIPRGQEKRTVITHGVPFMVPDLGSPVETMTDEEVIAFHLYADETQQSPSMHVGYLDLLLGGGGQGLLPDVARGVFARLTRLLPHQQTLLSIGWRGVDQRRLEVFR